MMRKEFVLVVAGAALSVGFIQAIASDTIGEIKRVDGAAMISKGEHFVAAQQGMKLQELDRLIVLEQSEALLEFDDGCRHLMKEKELLTVGATSVCVDSPVEAAEVAEVEGSTKTSPADLAAAQRTATSQLEAGAGLGAVGIGGGAALFGAVAGIGFVTTLAVTEGGGSNNPPTRPLGPISPE